MSRATLFIEHSLVYTNKEPVPIDDVLASLEAMKRISKRFLPTTLSRLTGSDIVGVEVLVDAFEYGSFKESFWLQLVFSSERSMKRFQKAFQKGDLAGMYKELPLGDKPVVKTIVVSAVIAALISYGTLKFVSQNGTKSEKALVEANNNTVIMIGAEAYQTDPKVFQGVIEAVTAGKQKQLAQDAAKILAPAQNEIGAKLEMGHSLEMPSAVIQAMPRDVEFNPHETEKTITGAVVDIRQTNRDSANSGWRGIIRDVVEEKVKLTLGEGVEISDLAGRLDVTADVKVRYRQKADSNELEPVEIVIEQVKPSKNG